MIVTALDDGGLRDSEGDGGIARAAVEDNDLPGASAAAGGGGGDNNGRQGRTLRGKGQEPAQRERQVRMLMGKGQVPAATTMAGKGRR
jgi:hypothetical protein